MKLLLEQFLFLTHLLDAMDESINIDDYGFTIEDFDKIDEELDKIIGDYDVDQVKQEIVELVKAITTGEVA